MIADARPPVIVRCLSAAGREKRSYFRRSDARRKLLPGEHTYRCWMCGGYHKTRRAA